MWIIIKCGSKDFASFCRWFPKYLYAYWFYDELHIHLFYQCFSSTCDPTKVVPYIAIENYFWKLFWHGPIYEADKCKTHNQMKLFFLFLTWQRIFFFFFFLLRMWNNSKEDLDPPKNHTRGVSVPSYGHGVYPGPSQPFVVVTVFFWRSPPTFTTLWGTLPWGLPHRAGSLLFPGHAGEVVQYYRVTPSVLRHLGPAPVYCSYAWPL